MVNRIVGFTLLPCMILALFLALKGVQHVDFGNTYWLFLRDVTSSYNSWKLEIPDIPKVPKIAGGTFSEKGLILAVLISIANFFVDFVNALIAVINFGNTIINICIQIIQFCFTLIYRCKDFIAGVVES